MSFSIVFSRQECSPFTPTNEADKKAAKSSSKEIFLKCIFPKGTSKEILKELKKRKIDIASENMEETPLDIMGSKVRSFLESWDTKGFSPIHVQAERRLLKNFLCSPRIDGVGINNFSFFRKNTNIQYSIHIIGSDLSNIEECFEDAFFDTEDRDVKKALLTNNDEVMGSAVKLFEKALEGQRSILIENKLAVKEGAVLLTENGLDMITQGRRLEFSVNFDARMPFTTFFEKYESDSQHYKIDPKAIYYFSLAPTICKILQVLDMGGIGIKQELMELKITN